MDIQFNGRTGEQISSDINQKFGEIEQIVNDAETGALASEQTAVEAAVTAEAAKVAAEAARDAAFVNADAYPDTAAGLSGTTVGDQFQVVSSDGFSIQRYRHDAGPVATPVGAPFVTANRLASAFPERSGWAWAALDAINQVLFGARDDGVFVAQGVEIVTQLTAALSRISGLENSIVISADPGRTGILFAVVDADNQMLMHLAVDMSFYVGGIIARPDADTVAQLNALQAAFDARFAASDNIVCYGTSITEGAGSTGGSNTYPARLATATGVSVSNQGIGGQDAQRISARANGYTTLVTVSGNEIPASGPVAVTTISPTLLTTPATTASRSRTGWLMGVHGTLAKDSSNAYTFTRTTAGDAVAVYPGSVFVLDLGTLADRIAVIEVGTNDDLTNDSEHQRCIDYVQAIIDAIPSLEKRYLVTPPFKSASFTAGTDTHTQLLAYHTLLKRKYKDRYVPVFEKLVASYDPGIPQDVTDYANGVIPSSLRADSVHLNDAGYLIVAQTVKLQLDRLGWVN